MSSSYKKVKLANQGWVGFTQICMLEPNKPYRMLGIIETNHATYGPGQQATIEAHDGRKWQTQLPGKYLAQLSKEDINCIKKDIMGGKHVFLVFREKMIDKSYRIDINESDAWMESFKANKDVPELDDSEDESGDGEKASGVDKKNPDVNAAGESGDAGKSE